MAEELPGNRWDHTCKHLFVLFFIFSYSTLPQGSDPYSALSSWFRNDCMRGTERSLEQVLRPRRVAICGPWIGLLTRRAYVGSSGVQFIICTPTTGLGFILHYTTISPHCPLFGFRSTVRAYFHVVARVLLTLIDQYLTPTLSSLRSYRTQHRFVANSSALFRLFSSAFHHFGPSWSLPGLFFRCEHSSAIRVQTSSVI